jgi:hypothetical protein
MQYRIQKNWTICITGPHTPTISSFTSGYRVHIKLTTVCLAKGQVLVFVWQQHCNILAAGGTGTVKSQANGAQPTLPCY